MIVYCSTNYLQDGSGNNAEAITLAVFYKTNNSYLQFTPQDGSGNNAEAILWRYFIKTTLTHNSYLQITLQDGSGMAVEL